MSSVESDMPQELSGVDGSLLDHVFAGVCVIREQRFAYVNGRLAEMLGYDVVEMLEGMEALQIVHPADRAFVLDQIRRREAGEVVEPYEIRLVDRGGEAIDTRVCGRRIRYAGASANLVTLVDIGELQRALRAADWRARMLAHTEDLCRGASLEIDLQQDRITASQGLGRLLGRPAAPSLSNRRAVLSLVAVADRRAVVDAWRNAIPGRPFELQHRLRRPDGRPCVVHQRGLIEPDASGNTLRGIAILQDVTTQRAAERRLQELASLDPATGLPNRAGLIERTDARLAGAEGSASQVILLAIEIPQITQVKEGLGFDVGDRLAMALAARLVASLPDGDVLARLAGGQFAVLVQHEAGVDVGQAVSARARAIEAALVEPLALDGTSVFATGAIGAARAPDDGTRAAALLSSAALALKSAVEAGPGQVRMASSRGNDRAMRRLALEWALRQAIAANELTLVYQPQVELHQGTVQGVEALLRWNSSTLGEVAPTEFVPVAEQSGQIVAIGDWVLREACAQAARWKQEGWGRLRVHVNISATQLARDDLADRVQAILLDAGADPAQLGIEVTESMLAGDPAKAARALGALRAIGIEIALDDFGTGYSNLSTLQVLPIDVIKIDRSYVHDVLAAAAEVSMTRAVITMAHSLQMRVLAEGVETESQLSLLLAHHCDAIQGFHFSHPVGAAEISALLQAGKRLPEHLFDRPPRQRTLLLVDDEENILASLKRLLRRGDYRIVTATSAAEGLQRLAQTDVDVIVSDQRMPGMTGVEFLRRAKELYPHTVRIVLSGYTELQSITAAINEGAIYKFLTKPWEDDLLRANIEEAFRQKEMADENRRLDQEVRTANGELAELNERLQAALARQHEELSLVEDRGRNALEVLYNVPMPLIGLDTDGLIAFANQDAERLLPGMRGWIGSYAEDCLPEGFQRVLALAEGESIELELAGVRCRCSSRLVDDSGGRRGKLVAMVPQMAGS